MASGLRLARSARALAHGPSPRGRTTRVRLARQMGRGPGCLAGFLSWGMSGRAHRDTGLCWQKAGRERLGGLGGKQGPPTAGSHPCPSYRPSREKRLGRGRPALCWTHSRRRAPRGSSRVAVPRQRRGTQAPRGEVACRVTAGLAELRSHRRADHWR